jgi:hypothetical protein
MKVDGPDRSTANRASVGPECSQATAAPPSTEDRRAPVAEPIVEEPHQSRPDDKFCVECGKSLRRRAEICPYCGCRQMPSSSPSAWSGLSNGGPEVGSSFVTQMAILILLNVLWSGLGNLAIGDKRGWGFGFLNWVVLVVSWFTLFIPSVLFFVYCSIQGYTYLQSKSAEAAC